MSSVQTNVVAASQYLESSRNLPAASAFSALMLLQVRTFGNYGSPWTLFSDSTHYIGLEYDTNGAIYHQKEPGYSFANITTGFAGTRQWLWLATTSDGTTIRSYSLLVPGGAFNTATTIAAPAITPTKLSIGWGIQVDRVGSENYAFVAFYNATLSVQEVQRQFSSKARYPLRRANLHAWSDCRSAAKMITDLGRGNGGAWTQVGRPQTISADPGFKFQKKRRLWLLRSQATAGSDASSAPTLSAGATGASLKAGDASCAPTLSGAATGASLAAAAASSAPTLNAAATAGASAAASAPTLSAGATGAALGAGAASSAPTLSAAATSSSLAASAASSAPTLNATPTGAALGVGVPSSAPSLTANATGQTPASDAVSAPTLSAAATGAAKSAGDASCAPTLNAAATSQGGSAAVSAPTLSAAATGASLAAAAASSAPTLSAAAAGASLAAGAPSSAPSFSAAPVGAVLYVAAASSAPSLSAGAGSAIGPRPDSQPTLSANATGKSLAAAAASCAPLLDANAGGQTNNTPSSGSKWRPEYYQKGWIPEYFGGL
jgi:hypothetical protein